MPDQIAKTLIQALPYIQEFSGKTVVVKYGGHAMIHENLKRAVMEDLVLMRYVGINPILVHGGGPEIDEAMRKVGLEPKKVNGLRVTDAETVEIVEMVLAGKTNKGIVAHLNAAGGKAVGLSGKDANLLVAEKETEHGDLGFVGRIVEVNGGIIANLVAGGYIPVISSVASGRDGNTYNINADTAAGAIAAAMGAVKLILMTDVEGVYRDFSDKSSLIGEMTTIEARQFVGSGAAEKGMIPKLDACIDAVANGVSRATIIDGRREHALLIETFTDTGIGTMIRPAVVRGHGDASYSGYRPVLV